MTALSIVAEMFEGKRKLVRLKTSIKGYKGRATETSIYPFLSLTKRTSGKGN
jgi:hypothetical protein